MRRAGSWQGMDQPHRQDDVELAGKKRRDLAVPILRDDDALEFHALADLVDHDEIEALKFAAGRVGVERRKGLHNICIVASFASCKQTEPQLAESTKLFSIKLEGDAIAGRHLRYCPKQQNDLKLRKFVIVFSDLQLDLRNWAGKTDNLTASVTLHGCRAFIHRRYHCDRTRRRIYASDRAATSRRRLSCQSRYRFGKPIPVRV